MFGDISFYFQIGLIILLHAKPESLQAILPVLQQIYDVLKTVPGIKP